MTLAGQLAGAEPLLAHYGYAAVFAAVLVENAGVPAPGQTLVIAAALLAARGDLSVWAVLGAAAAGGVAGGALGFVVGRQGGRRLFERFASPRRLARLEELFARWGAALVALGRFVDGTRQLAALSAGVLEMPSARFMWWNLVGAVLWSSCWVFAAYGFGEHVATIHRVVHGLRPWMLAAGLIAAGAAVAWVTRTGRSG